MTTQRKHGLVERIRIWYGNWRAYRCPGHCPSQWCTIPWMMDDHKTGCPKRPCKIPWPGSPRYKVRMKRYEGLRE